MFYDDLNETVAEWLTELVNRSIVFVWNGKNLNPLGNPRLMDSDESGYAGTWANEDVRVVFPIRLFQDRDPNGKYITVRLPRPYEVMVYNGIQFRISSVRVSTDYGGCVSVTLTRNVKPKTSG